jgi:hypothetical protein
VGKTHFILILIFAASRLFAQPALPATNRTFAPIANPYSASWIYYTTDSISGLGYLNGASIPYVMTASNSAVNYINAATNGFVTAGITNGLATTNYVRTATNGFVTAAITNGLATTNFVLSQNYVTATVTNGLASISYVDFGTNFAGTNGQAQLNSASNSLAAQIVAATNGLGNIVMGALLRPAVIWTGVSGGTLAVNSTHYAAPNNNTSMTATTDTTGITRAPAPQSLTLTNLYVATSANLGAGHTATLTIMTNGVATSIAVTISGAAQNTGNDTTHSVTIPAGTLIGVRVVTGAAISLVDWSWSFEGW